MFYQIFLSLQVKRCAIITYKHGMYELPNELPNDLRLRILVNYEILGMCLNPATSPENILNLNISVQVPLLHSSIYIYCLLK